MLRYILSLLISFICSCTLSAQKKSDGWLERLLRENTNPTIDHVLDNPDSFQYQIIYTRIDRDKTNKPSFTNYFLNVDRRRYFYPASTAKLPVALLALEKLNELKTPDLNMNSTMLTDSAYSGQTRVINDSTSATGMPSVANYIRKIFLVSDNDAYNRLYEFLGQQQLNEKLWKKGYTDVRITHRFVPLTAGENKHTNPIRFMSGDKMVYKQPAVYSKLRLDTTHRIFVGERYLDKEERLINSPMDFTFKNRLPLEDLQRMLQSVLFPESFTQQQRFNLTDEDRRFVLRYMSQLPSETSFLAHDTAEFFDSFTKFYFFRAGKSKIPSHIRVFNKAGWSYGFLTDAAYIIDLKNNVEFMLTGTIYTNSDGILNDDHYEYEQVGYPFFKAVGEMIYQYELKRPRKYAPDLSAFKMQYGAQ
jgi:hypothetical protein